MSLKSPGNAFDVRPTQLDPAAASAGEVPTRVDDNTQDVEVRLSPIDTKDQKLSDETLASSDLASIKIEPKRVIPYATIHIQGHQIDSIQDMLGARSLERRLGDRVTTHLYSIAEGPTGKPDMITSANEQVDQELEELEKKIAAIDSLKMTYEQIDAVFRKNDQVKDITALMKENAVVFGLDPLTASEIDEASDYQMIIHELTALSVSDIKSKLSNTRRYLQCLYDAQFALSMGVGASFLIPGNSRTFPGLGKDISHAWLQGAQSRHPGLKSLDNIGLRKSPAFDGLLGTPQSRLPDLGSMSPIQRVAYYSTILSRELLLSAGLGRLDGTLLGQTFGVGREDPYEQFFGTKAVTMSVATANPPANSLANLALVKENGALNAQSGPGKKVFFLEGGDQGISSSRNTTNSKKQWIVTIKDNPFHNDMDIFNATIQQATDRFSTAEQFLSILLCRDQERTLLTPRGLFTRIIKDFSVLLAGAALVRGGDSRGPKKDALSELVVLEAAGRTEISSEDFFIDDVDLGEATAETRGNLRSYLSFYLGRGLLERRQTAIATAAEEDADVADLDAALIIAAAGGPSSPSTDSRMRLTASKKIIKQALGSPIDVGRKTGLTDALVLLADASRPHRGMSWTGRRGSAIAYSFFQKGRHGVEGNIEEIILKIYEDLEAEAQSFAKVDGDSRTFLRERGLTANAAFDGMICITILLECFIQLTRALADVKLVLRPGTLTHRKQLTKSMGSFQRSIGTRSSSSMERVVGLRTGETRDHFNKYGQKLYYPSPRSGVGSLDQIQKFLKELAAASEGDDLSALIDADGKVPAVEGLEQNTQLGPSDEVTPLSLIGTMEQLSLEDDSPTVLFSIAKSFIDNMSMKSKFLSQKAAALKGDSQVDTPDDVVILREMRSSKLSSDFLKAMSDSQIKWARARVETLKNASDDGYMINRTNLDLFKVYHMLLEEKKNEFTDGVILFMGMPNGSIADEVAARELDEDKAVLELEIDKIDESNPHIVFKEKKKTFLLNCDTNGTLISEAMSQVPLPTTFGDLVTAVKFNLGSEPEPLTGDEIIFRSSNPSRTREYLSFELESFVLKSMYQEMTGFALHEEMIQFDPLMQRSEHTVNLSKELMRPLGLDDITVARLFVKQGNEVSLPGKLRLDSLIQPQNAPALETSSPQAGAAKIWSVPLVTPAQVSVFYDLFATKPFFADKVEDFVLSKTIFDRVYAVFVDLDDFEMDKKASLKSYRMVYWHRGGRARRQRWWRSKRDFKRRRPAGSFSMPALYIGAKLV